MRVELAFDHFIGRLDDHLAERGVQLAERHVGLGGGLLDDAEGADDRGGLALPADLEIAQRALRLRAPVLVRFDLDGAKGIGFGAGVGGLGGHEGS